MDERPILQDSPSAPDRHSPEWWASLTGDELQNILKRGLIAGDIFFEASAEAKRRERVKEERGEFLASLENAFSNKKNLLFWFGTAIVAIIILGIVGDMIGR